jgi:hypothetical protein
MSRLGEFNALELAVLTNQGILDAEALYLLYYDDVTDHPEVRVRSLADYCGTDTNLRPTMIGTT